MNIFSKALKFFIVLLLFIPIAKASPNISFTQQINAGILSVDIVDGSYNSVATPSFPMSALSLSVLCQTPTGTLGTSSQKIYVQNPGQANNGWVVSIAATNGNTSAWVNQSAGANYDFNDGNGCTDGADADSLGGQLTINPSTGTVTNGQCTGCTTTGVTLGSSAPFVQGTTDSITVLTGSAGTEDIADYLLTGVGVSQRVPASQPVANYKMDLTLTIISL